jgi:Domain of unknown function (DUF1707)
MADLNRHPGRLPLRIGDAERDAALRELGDHFAAGRIDGTEFDERASAALAARTQPELDVLFADLPRPRQARSRPPGRGRGHFPAFAPVLFVLLLLFLISTGGPWLVLPLLWLWVATRWWRWAPPPPRRR